MSYDWLISDIKVSLVMKNSFIFIFKFLFPYILYIRNGGSIKKINNNRKYDGWGLDIFQLHNRDYWILGPDFTDGQKMMLSIFVQGNDNQCLLCYSILKHDKIWIDQFYSLQKTCIFLSSVKKNKEKRAALSSWNDHQ